MKKSKSTKKDKPKTLFYIREFGQLVETKGKQLTLNGIPAFAFRTKTESWRVAHDGTGLLLHLRVWHTADRYYCHAFETRKEAIQDAKENLAKFRDSVNAMIAKATAKYGFNSLDPEQISLF